MKEQWQNRAMGLVDTVAAALPRRVPAPAKLLKCKIVSHRGEHDNSTVMENTLKAFTLASEAGVWGIECDLRWTQDDVPVICHDADTARVFGQTLTLSQTPFSELRKRLPAIPTLAELVDTLAPATHLMLELKSFNAERLAQQRDILGQHLERLRPVDDYHILALDPALFPLADFAPPRAMLPVAETNVAALSALSLARGYRGLAGHFLLLHRGVQRRHQAAGQCVGVGFPRSRNSLFRELERGVEWVFSNDAVKLQGIVDRALRPG